MKIRLCVIGVSLTFLVPKIMIGQQALSLAMPRLGENPYTTSISSILDHQVLSEFYCDANSSGAERVLAFNGQAGWLNPDEVLEADDCTLYGYTEEDALPNYVLTYPARGYQPTRYLYYDGHPGYDFPGIFNIVAPAAGTVYIPVEDTISGTVDKCPYEATHTFYIDHGGQWTTWYLHADRLLLDLPDDFSPSEYCEGDPLPSDIEIGPVMEEEAVAVSGWHGLDGPENTHLHFEVRYNGKIVDPYGWNWTDSDPLAESSEGVDPLAGAVLWKGYSRPKIDDIYLHQIPTPEGDPPRILVVADVDNPASQPNASATLWEELEPLGGSDSIKPARQLTNPASVAERQRRIYFPVDNTLLRPDKQRFVRIQQQDGPLSKPGNITSAPLRKCAFPDLLKCDWPLPYIDYLCQLSIFNGDGETGLARHGDPTNRAEAAKLVVDAIIAANPSISLPNPVIQVYEDVPVEEFYAPHVQFLREHDILDETPLFRPGDEIKRSELVKILVETAAARDEGIDDFLLTKKRKVIRKTAERYLDDIDRCENLDEISFFERFGCEEEPEEEFTDVDDRSAWFYFYVYGAREMGFIDGYQDEERIGQFGPDNVVLRGEAAKMMYCVFFGQEGCSLESESC